MAVGLGGRAYCCARKATLRQSIRPAIINRTSAPSSHNRHFKFYYVSDLEPDEALLSVGYGSGCIAFEGHGAPLFGNSSDIYTHRYG